MEKIKLERRDGKSPIWTDEHLEHMKKMYEDEHTLIEIAEVFDVSYGTIKNQLKKTDVVFRTASENKLLKDKKYGYSRKHDVNMDFFKEWSHDMAYVLGFIYADGHVVYKETVDGKKGKYALIINLVDTDLSHPEKIKEVMQYTGNIRVGDSKGGKLKVNGEPTRFSSLRISSKELVQPLSKFNMFGAKSLTIKYPKDLPEEYEIDFIRGYFDGNGSVGEHMGNNIRTRIFSGSGVFLESIQEIMQKHGFEKRNVSKSDRGSIYDIGYSTNDSIKIYDLLYKNKDSMRLNRKFERFTELVNKRK